MNNKTEADTTETATFGAGCFWCVEAIFSRVKGVGEVKSGYCGGHTNNPTYKEVCKGTTGHAEVCQITFNPKVIEYKQLLLIFWQIHDPTTPNRQGNDIGSQYRSVIFYHSKEQELSASQIKNKLEAEKLWDKPIVTQIAAFDRFYRAENYHDNYFDTNPNQQYCTFVIAPKVEKFKKLFEELIKKPD